MKKFKKYIIALLCFLTYLNVNAQDSLIYIKKIDIRHFEIYDQNNRIKGNIISSDKIKEIKISPDEKYISYINKPSDLSKPNSFKILSENSEVLLTINENVRKYEWSNSSNQIALITGKYYEGGSGFTPEEVIIYDLINKSKNVLEVQYDEFWPYGVTWSFDDSRLYIKTFGEIKVYEYNINEKTINKTNLIDIFFSPDNKYYYQKHSLLRGTEFAVYDVKTNQRISLNSILKNHNKNRETEYGKLIGWASGNYNMLLYKKLIEDVEYEDIIVREKSETQSEIISRKYKKRELTGIKYTYYNVEKDAIEKVLETNGAEHKLMKSKNIIIYQEDGKSEFKEFKFQLAID